MPRTQEQNHKAGQCPCGRAIMIGQRYTVTVGKSQKIERMCQCGRTNVVELHASVTVSLATWKVCECNCKRGYLYLPSEYAGVGFDGYRGLPIVRKDSYRPRRTSVTCSACSCRWYLRIFFKNEDGKETSDMHTVTRRSISTKIRRCRPCAERKTREAQAS